MGFFRRYIYGPSRKKPQKQKVHAAQTQRGRAAQGAAGAETFDFHEGLVVGPSATCKHNPPTGTVVVEILRADGILMALDVFRASYPAPNGPFFPLPNLPATHVRPGTGGAHQEFEFDLNGPHPIELPEHLVAKINIGATRARVWWSCE